MKWHLALSALINTKRTRPGMSTTEKIALVLDVPGRVCYFETLKNENVGLNKTDKNKRVESKRDGMWVIIK